MGCGCGSKTPNQEWIFQINGTTKVYKTEVEARAAQIRQGGGTITVKAK